MRLGRYARLFGPIRDGAIALISIVYVSGYVCWSIHAWRHGLGIATPLDLHYFVAGVPMLVVVGATAVVTFGLKAAVERVMLPHLNSPRRRERAKIFLVIVVMMSMLLFIGTVRYHQAVRLPISTSKVALLFIPALLGFLAMAVSTYVDPPSDPTTVRVGTRFGLLLSGFMYAYLFIAYLYPMIPGALGGGAPRRAQLDVRTEDMSAATLSMLCQCDARGRATVRTQDVWVYPSVGDIAVTTVRPHLESDAPRQTIQLRRDVVSAINWRER